MTSTRALDDVKLTFTRGLDDAHTGLDFFYLSAKMIQLKRSLRGRIIGRVGAGIRIPLVIDRRIFTSVARSSYKWKRLYKKRTAVDRVNSRLDTTFGFEHHTMRGSKKVSLKLTLAFSIMLSIALGWTKEKHPELIRSMCRSA